MKTFNIELLQNEAITNFIESHRDKDVFEIGLNFPQKLIEYKVFIIDQLVGLQKSRKKLPTWYNTVGILFPEKIALEQCSSEITASYKSKMVAGKTLIDLTGGFGVDSYYFSKTFTKVTHLERNEGLSDIVKYNFDLLGVQNVDVVCSDGIDYLQKFDENYDVIYIDPSRRSTSNAKVYKLQDCEPNIAEILPLLLERCKILVIKTSPWLDIHEATKQLKYVKETHIVSVDNECKEVLYMLENSTVVNPSIKTINYANTGVQQFSFTKSQEESSVVKTSDPLRYLYEPNASVMKSGGFNIIGAAFGLFKLNPNTHLYTSEKLVEQFAGKSFKIKATLNYKDKSVHQYITDGKANVVTRNIPYTAEDVKASMGIKDGGKDFVFGIRDASNKLLVVVAEKVE